MEFKDTIGIYPNALDKDKCKEVIDLFETKIAEKKAHAGTTVQGINPEVKETIDFDLGSSIKIKDVDIKESILNCFNTYTYEHYLPSIVDLEVFPFDTGLVNNTFYNGLNLQKYLENQGHFKRWHVENSNKVTSTRAFVYILYLNDVDEGGTTDFLFKDGKTDDYFSIQPKQGTLVIHPASFPYIHRGNIPVSGDKYIATTWLEFIE